MATEELKFGYRTGARWDSKNSDYVRFRRSLDVDFSGIDKEELDKITLKNSMDSFGYHRTKDKELSVKYGDRVTKKIPITEEQFNFAWDYLKGKGVTKQTILYFKEEKYGYRANQPKGEYIYHKGKTYRRGQFLPKSVKYGY